MELCLLIRFSTWIFLSVFGFRSRYEAGKCRGDVPEQSGAIQKVISFFFLLKKRSLESERKGTTTWEIRFLGEMRYSLQIGEWHVSQCCRVLLHKFLPLLRIYLAISIRVRLTECLQSKVQTERHKIHVRVKMRSCKISHWWNSTVSSITLSTIASTVLSERQRSDSSRSAKTNSLSCLKEQSDYFD